MLMDWISGEYIDVILFYLPPGIMPLAAAKLTYHPRLLYYIKAASTAVLKIPRPRSNAYLSVQNRYPIGLPPIHICSMMDRNKTTISWLETAMQRRGCDLRSHHDRHARKGIHKRCKVWLKQHICLRKENEESW